MTDQKTIKNYAYSLFENISSVKEREKVLEQMSLFNDTVQKSSLMRFALEAPVVSKTDKLKVVEAFAAKSSLVKVLHRFFALMIKNARFEILPQVIEEYKKLLAANKGIKFILVESAKKLGKKELEFIKKYLENKLDKTIELEVKENKSLIGGVVISYDSMLYDLSIAGMIDKFARKLGA